MPSLVNAVKTLAKLQMQYNTANNLKQSYSAAKKEIESKLPEFTVSNIKYRDGGSVAEFEVKYDGKTFTRPNFDREVKSEKDFDRIENGMDSVNDMIKKDIIDRELNAIFGKIPSGAMVTYELETKIKRQKNKIQQLSKEHNTEI